MADLHIAPISAKAHGGVGVLLREVTTVLVKFYFTNPDHVPPGIKEKVRDQYSLDLRHAQEAIEDGEFEKTIEGRLRPGHIDTGECVINNLPTTQAAMLRTGLVNNNFRLTDAHWYLKQDLSKKKFWGKHIVLGAEKRVVSLSFARPKVGASLPQFSKETVEAMRSLSNSAVWFCHVWQNLNGVATVNFVGRQPTPPAKPKNAIVVREGLLTSIPITSHVAEVEE